MSPDAPPVPPASAFDDQQTRVWRDPLDGPVTIGSDRHKVMFCRMLLGTINPYRPAIIDWPMLEPAAQQRLTSLPIWDIAVSTEEKAMQHVAHYAAVVKDPLLQEAISRDGFEEGRHKTVLANLVAAYGIVLPPEPVYLPPRDAEWGFLLTGYSECIDSFFAFGLFELSRQSGFFPPELVEVFEPVIQEEARHILFFVNWAAWHRRTMPWWRRPWFELKVAAIWLVLIWERLALARSLGAEDKDNNFTVTGAQSLGIDLDTGRFIDLCLRENDRRMHGYDPRLLRPTLVPRLVRLARRFMRQRP